VQIRVENASVELRQIDFSLAEAARAVRRRRR